MKFPIPRNSAAALAVSALLLLVLLAACHSGTRGDRQAGDAIPMHEDPVHQIVLRNEVAAVYRAELLPGRSTRLHRHDTDYVYVVLGRGELEDFSEGEPSKKVRLQEGEVRYAGGGFAHRDVNIGSTPFVCIAAEILKRPVHRAARTEDAERIAGRSLDIGHGHIEDVVLENEQVRVTDVQVAPGARTDDEESIGPRLLVLMSDAELHPGSPAAAVIRGNKGDVFWRAEGDGSGVHNAGEKQVRFISIEFQAERSR